MDSDDILAVAFVYEILISIQPARRFNLPKRWLSAVTIHCGVIFALGCGGFAELSYYVIMVLMKIAMTVTILMIIMIIIVINK